MCQYVRFVADRLLYALGCDKAYHDSNPFDCELCVFMCVAFVRALIGLVAQRGQHHTAPNCSKTKRRYALNPC